MDEKKFWGPIFWANKVVTSLMMTEANFKKQVLRSVV
jgi:hypothetical protein